MSSTDSDGGDQGPPDNVEMFQRINRLKGKAGGDPNSEKTGSIDPEAIAQADEFIKEFCADCPTLMKEVLDKLKIKWEEMKTAGSSAASDPIAQEIFTLAHEVKDVAGLCGYGLMSEFAESLRDYVVETDLDHDAKKVIIQAHVDVINVAFKQNMMDHGGDAADELKDSLKKAIARYK